MVQHYAYPTPIHQQAAESIVEFFSARGQVNAVVLVNSCARGTATPESDLDMAILVNAALDNSQRGLLERQWLDYYASHPIFTALKTGRFSGVHLDLFDGHWTPEVWDEGGGPDAFEIEIGNRVAYGVPLWERSGAFAALRSVWLPYYSADLQQKRLQMVRQSCQLNISRLQFYVRRGLYFQAFDRLYHAFQEFLQAVFIARRVYPIAYNKWIREQIVDWLGLAALYAQLPPVLEIGHLESDEMVRKGDYLLQLLDTWASCGSRSE
jgi:hypothetical protein